MTEGPAAGRSLRERFKLGLLAAAWLWFGLFSAKTLAFHLPAPVAAWLTEPSYFSLVWLTVTALGGAVCFAFLERPREALGLVRPRGGVLLPIALLAPALLALSLFLAWTLALPTLQEELLARGHQAVKASVSSANRAARQANLSTIAVWTILVTPVAEELLFRGAIWSAIAGLCAAEPKARSLPPAWLERSAARTVVAAIVGALGRGGLATLASAVVFAWLHLEGHGGAAIVAATQTLCLGLAAGVARQTSGSVLASIVLHGCFNALTLLGKRTWAKAPKWPLPLPIPLPLWWLALGCTGAALLVILCRWAYLRRRVG